MTTLHTLCVCVYVCVCAHMRVYVCAQMRVYVCMLQVVAEYCTADSGAERQWEA
jgi:hypothetical protein